MTSFGTLQYQHEQMPITMDAMWDATVIPLIHNLHQMSIQDTLNYLATEKTDIAKRVRAQVSKTHTSKISQPCSSPASCQFPTGNPKLAQLETTCKSLSAPTTLLSKCNYNTTTTSPASLYESSSQQVEEQFPRISRAPRPSNGFILYRQAKHAELMREGKSLNSIEMTKLISSMWKSEPEDVKLYYKMLVAEASS